MSGGGVDPTYDDTTLPSETEQQQHNIHEQEDFTPSKPNQKTTNKPRNFFSFNRLNSLAIILILAATGLVGLHDFAFVIFSTIYMLFLSRVAFPVNNTPTDAVFGFQNKILRLYVSVGAIIGLFLPIAYIIHGIFRGDREGINAAAPHLFLLACQVFMEGITFWGEFSIPIRVFVPVVYNSMRIFAIIEWLGSEFSKVRGNCEGCKCWLQFGVALALANLGFWCFNLFGFLLPFYLPKAFGKYYSVSSNKVKHN